MKLVQFTAKLSSLDGNPLELAAQLRSIAQEIEESAPIAPTLLASQVKDAEGFHTGSWVLKRFADGSL